VLYSNAQAERLCEDLKQLEGTPEGPRLPQLIEAVATRLQEHGGGQGLSLQTVLEQNGTGPIVLQAFAIPQAAPREEPIIIILVERRQLDGDALVEEPATFDEPLRLTAREKQVLDWLRRGYTNKEIAGQLRISEQTVKKHISSLMLKTRVPNRTGVLARLSSRYPTRTLTR
jgi:DNA-binding CsgD family transcriptional regulator